MNNLKIYNGIFFFSASVLVFLALLRLISSYLPLFFVLFSLPFSCSSSSIFLFYLPSSSFLTSSPLLSASVTHPSDLPAVPLMSVDDAGGFLAD